MVRAQAHHTRMTASPRARQLTAGIPPEVAAMETTEASGSAARLSPARCLLLVAARSGSALATRPALRGRAGRVEVR